MESPFLLAKSGSGKGAYGLSSLCSLVQPHCFNLTFPNYRARQSDGSGYTPGCGSVLAAVFGSEQIGTNSGGANALTICTPNQTEQPSPCKPTPVRAARPALSP
jgi:hypothetical protein